MSTRAHHGLLLGAGATDPYFANVVLLLDGTSTTDLSSYAHSASVGANVTIDSGAGSNNGSLGTSSIRTNGTAPCNLTYSPATEWRFDPIYTLEWDMYIDSAPSNWLFFCTDDFNRFWQVFGGTINFNLQGKWGSLGTITAETTYGWVQDTWHHVVEVSNGTDVSVFIDGVQVITNGVSQSADGSDKGFEVLDPNSSAPDYRFMNVRYTQGVARYNPLAPAIAVPTAPWPTS